MPASTALTLTRPQEYMTYQAPTIYYTTQRITHPSFCAVAGRRDGAFV
jgi:hypothetical protein